MTLYLLDTCVLITILQANNNRNCKSSERAREDLKIIDKALNLKNIDAYLIASVVSYAELLTFSRRNKWKPERIDKLEEVLGISKLTYVEIRHDDPKLMDAYSLIDNYSLDGSQKHKSKSGSVRMSKNDIWIAATALNLQAELVTNDKDFNHLPPELLTVHRFSFPTNQTGPNT